MGLNAGVQVAPLRIDGDKGRGRFAAFVLLVVAMLAVLAGAGLAQQPAEAGLQVQPWDARQPVRSFTLTSRPDQDDIDIGAELFGQPGRELQTAEAGTKTPLVTQE